MKIENCPTGITPRCESVFHRAVFHYFTTYHCYAIVEQRLSKHNDIKHLIDMDFFKHRDDRDRIHG